MTEEISNWIKRVSVVTSFKLKQKLIDFGVKEHRCEVCNRSEWNGKAIPIELHHKDGNSENNSLENLEIVCPNCHAQTDNYKSKNRKISKYDFSEDEMVHALENSFSISEAMRSLGVNRSVFVRRQMSSLLEQGKASLKQKPKKQIKKRKPISKRIPKIKKKYFCIDCGNEITRNAKRCPSCHYESKTKRPPKEVLKKLVWSIPSSQIAEKYKVSDKAICKWCKFYDIEKPPRGYWQQKEAGKI